MGELFAFVVANQTSLIGVITSIAGLMSMIASMAPGVGKNSTWNFIRGVIDLLAFNFGNAKNHRDIEVETNEKVTSNFPISK